MLKELIITNRSYRRFAQSEEIPMEVVRGLVDLARLSPSAANLQPLRYIISRDANMNARIFPHLAWAGYLQDWPGPAEGERPAAYIIILGDLEVCANFGCDHGIAAQSILLGAAEKGLGGCMIGSIKKEELRRELGIPERYEILLVIALGRPVEKVVLEPLGPGGSMRYWRDKDGTHHVPKRPLDSMIIIPEIV